jgi:hypothetical protein
MTPAGLITAQQYAEVRIGQTRSAVHDRLGREGDDASWFFPPVAPGLRDFYHESNAGPSPDAHLYQFCFRAGVLVRKDLSTQPYGS